jgi:hypothetical protein
MQYNAAKIIKLLKKNLKIPLLRCVEKLKYPQLIVRKTGNENFPNVNLVFPFVYLTIPTK